MSFWSQRRDDTPPAAGHEPQAPSRPAAPKASAKRTADRAPASSPAASTLIAPGSTFVGEITGNTELLVKGVVKGQIDLDSRVVVGAEGRIEGDIRARSIEIAGKVNGNVRCESLLKVHASGSLEGEVVTVDLDVDSGCFLSGRVQRVKAGEVGKGKPAKATAAPEKKAAPADTKTAPEGSGGKNDSKSPNPGRNERQRNRQGQPKTASAGKR